MLYGKTGRGLRYAVKRSGSAVAYCALSIKCGTRDEAGYNSGIAHFTEHTIFKGTAKKSASVINGYLDRLGGELNAYTTKEEIVIHATVLKEDLRKAVSLLLELVTCPTFPENEVDTERGVIIDEINSYKDSPYEEVYDRFEELLFAGHPLSGPILGTVSSVKKITTSELLRFVKEKFRPENMAFTIVADRPEEKMESAIRNMVSSVFSGSWVSSGSPANPVPVSPLVPRRFDIVRNRRNHQVNCVMGSTAPSLYDEQERMAAILLSNILGGPASNSVLNSVLREKNGWVYGVECSYTQYSDTGIMAVCLGCEKENMEKCLKAVSREVDKLKDMPLSDRRLKAAKKQLLGQLAISGDNGETQCLSMGKSLLAYGRVLPSEENRARVEAVTAQQIRDVACSVFDTSRISRLVFI